MQRSVQAGVALLALAAGCGGSVEGAADPTPQARSTSADPTPATSPPPAVSLRESCPQVEAALPGGAVPPAAKWREFSAKLDRIAAAGDLETKNAVQNLQQAADALAAGPPAGDAYLDASEDFLDAVSDLAGRCRDVGSSALQ
jgi:hypothetical protein